MNLKFLSHHLKGYEPSIRKRQFLVTDLGQACDYFELIEKFNDPTNNDYESLTYFKNLISTNAFEEKVDGEFSKLCYNPAIFENNRLTATNENKDFYNKKLAYRYQIFLNMLEKPNFSNVFTFTKESKTKNNFVLNSTKNYYLPASLDALKELKYEVKSKLPVDYQYITLINKKIAGILRIEGNLPIKDIGKIISLTINQIKAGIKCY